MGRQAALSESADRPAITVAAMLSQPECHGASHGQPSSSVMIVPSESETDSGRCGTGGQNGCHGFGLGALQKMVLGRRRAMVAGPSPSQLSGV